ncbi:MAG: hypothetical protein HY071_00415 [Chloroflexi bacterium]|nr:hypothetical protein [Chloroflexota bacterium]
MRKAKWFAGLLASVALLFNGGANFASADPGGNNGDVKIHDADTSQEDHRSEPHVCRFYIDGFNFDKDQSGTWTIGGQAPTKSNVGSSGTWGPADSHGNWRTSVMTLPDGHYKLDVNTGKGDGKHKVFWVECGKTHGTETAASPTPTPTRAPSSPGPTANAGEKSAPTNGGTKKSKGSKGTNGSGTGSKNTGSVGSMNTGGAKGTNGSNTGSVSTKNGSQSIEEGSTSTPAPSSTPTPLVTSRGGSEQEQNTGTENDTIGAQVGTQLGVQTPPSGNGTTSVSPMIENMPASVPLTQPGTQNGTEAGIQTLPSTSTLDGTTGLSLLSIALSGLGALMLRRPSKRED